MKHGGIDRSYGLSYGNDQNKRQKRYTKKIRTSSNSNFREENVEAQSIGHEDNYTKLRQNLSSHAKNSNDLNTISKPIKSRLKFEKNNSPKISISYIKNGKNLEMQNGRVANSYITNI